MIIIKEFEDSMQNKIKNFVIETMKNEIDNISKEEFQKSIGDLNDIRKNYIDKSGCFLYAFDDVKNKVVGSISLTKNSNVYILKRFYVDSLYRSQGIGKNLYKALENIIYQNDIQNVYLTSGENLKKAHLFYLKNGWDFEEINPGIYLRKGAYLFKKEFIKMKIRKECLRCRLRHNKLKVYIDKLLIERVRVKFIYSELKVVRV